MPIINQVVQGSGGGSGPRYYIDKSVDANGKMVEGNTIIDTTGVTEIGENILASAYSGNTNISGAVNFSSITKLNRRSLSACFSGTHITSFNMSGLTTLYGLGCLVDCCSNCTDLVSADLQSVTVVEQEGFRRTFSGCTNFTTYNLDSVTSAATSSFNETFKGTKITSLSLPNITTVSGSYCFQSVCESCVYLTSVNLPKLKIANQSYAFVSAFKGCSLLPTAGFPSLSEIKQQRVFSGAFVNCVALQSLWFYALTPSSFGTQDNQFETMLNGCSNVTVHFPMAIQSTIGSWSSVTGGFNGTNTTVLFDIVTSLTGADGNTYTRSEKDSTSTATAWVYNDTLYYTSGVSNNTAGVNEPSVADTIYSDDACTQSVTTITAIA